MTVNESKDPSGDVEDFCKLEADLKDSERRYRCLFEGSKDMIFIAHKDGTFQDVNQAAVDLLGYASKADLMSVGSAVQVYHHAMHWEVFQRQINREGFVKDFEAKFKKKDGNLLHCLLSGNAVWGKDGDIIGYQGIAKDITARMDAIQNFRQRHRELWVLNAVAFAMNKTHDLDAVLEIALKKALEVLGLTAGAIFLIDHDQAAYVMKKWVGLPEGIDDATSDIRLHDESLMQALLKKDLTLNPEPIFPPFAAVLKHPETGYSLELVCFLITAKEKASGFWLWMCRRIKTLPAGRIFTCWALWVTFWAAPWKMPISLRPFVGTGKNSRGSRRDYSILRKWKESVSLRNCTMKPGRR